MNQQGGDRAEELFAEALALDKEQWPAFLDRVCGDNGPLRREVETLLTAHAAAVSFLEVPAVTILPESRPPNADDSSLIGSSIGSYRLTRLIGAGGMGRVFESEQGSPRRTVALKLMNSALASRSARRRFEYEAEILARLQHPGIAQIYEAGIHEDPSGSIPFFAMELVSQGRSILDHARRQHLSRNQCLTLFADVCDAVHHGHQKGIIHRDLKPGNILVDPGGKPKIIDFGVARTTQDHDAEKTRMTRAGELVGTLQYMSPEQCTDDPDAIDVRSDVYALGLVLYELLTGQRPYDLSRTPLVEAAHIIHERRVPRPSFIDRALRGDLDSIVLKALEKDRERRYASAADLGQDIRRYLRREPIDARPPSAVYHLRKFVSRYRLPAVLAGLLVLSVTVLAIVTTVMSASLAEERDRAEAETDTVRRIAEFQKDMLIAAAPRVAQGREVTVREVLDHAADLVGEKLQDTPEVESAIRDTIGQAYYGLARYNEAEEQYLAALDIRRSNFGMQDTRTLNTRNNLAVLYTDMGRYAEAEPLHRAAIEEQRQLLGDDHPDTLGSRINYAFVLERLDRRAEAIDLLEDVLDTCQTALGPDAPETVTATNTLAVLYAKEGQYEQAAPLFEQCYKTALRLDGPDHPRTLAAMNNLARLYEHTGRLEDAETMMRDVIAQRVRVLGEDHPATLTAQSNLASILEGEGRLEEAEAVLQDVLIGRHAQLGDNHPDTLSAERDYAHVLHDLGRDADAEQHYTTALAGFRAVLPAGHERIITTELSLGICLRSLGRDEEAEPLLLDAFTALSRSEGLSHPTTQRAVRELIALYETLGDAESADEFRLLLEDQTDDSE